MEPLTPLDIALEERAAQRRERALAAIAKYRMSSIAMLIPVWFALLMALLMALLPARRSNPVPYVAAMAAAVVWVTVAIIRGNRRLEAIAQLVTLNSTSG
ncbi:MAG TPA: hypothetical protein VMF03_00040 [Steroidobacteraceae bacterium]|nr:hypothetical protein [Steroidobacteraceae bacterium]